MATLQNITKLLKDIEENIATLIKQETELSKQIELLSRENNKLITHLKPEQPSPPKASLNELPPYNPQPQQSPLSSIAGICAVVIERNKILLSNREELSKLSKELKTLVPGISIKYYILGCKESIKECYDRIDSDLGTKLSISKQVGQETIFQKGYLLYDLVRDNTMDEFIELLRDTSKTYNTVVNEPKPKSQTGGAPSTLLQVIGLTKIKAIIEFMNSVNATNLDISNVTNANALIDKEDVINAIAKFFYEQPLMLQQQDKN